MTKEAHVSVSFSDLPEYRAYLMKMRQALLLQVDAIEEFLGIERTSEIRKRDAARQWDERNTSYSGEGLS